MAHSSWEKDSNGHVQILVWTIGQLDNSTNTQLVRLFTCREVWWRECTIHSLGQLDAYQPWRDWAIRQKSPAPADKYKCILTQSRRSASHYYHSQYLSSNLPLTLLPSLAATFMLPLTTLLSVSASVIVI